MPTRLFSIGFATALVVFMFALPRQAHAQGFIAPLLGYDFSGDSGCPNITGCEDKKLNIGVGVGSVGKFAGGEFEVSYAKDFFGKAPGYKSSVLTLMGNLLLGPKIGPVRPYGTAGLGLIKSHVDFTAASITDSSNNDFGWDIGGGLMIYAGSHFGVRGDIRHFHSFKDMEVIGIRLSNTKLDFGRASGAVILGF